MLLSATVDAGVLYLRTLFSYIVKSSAPLSSKHDRLQMRPIPVKATTSVLNKDEEEILDQIRQLYYQISIVVPNIDISTKSSLFLHSNPKATILISEPCIDGESNDQDMHTDLDFKSSSMKRLKKSKLP